MTRRIALIFLCIAPLLAQSQFAEYCSGCHGSDAHGSAKAPGLANNPRIAEQSADQLRAYIQHGNPNAGMPAFAALSTSDLTALTRFLLRLNKDTIFDPPPPPDASSKITYGPPQPGDWRTYNGSDSGNRYSPLKQITTANIASLKLKWIFPLTYFGTETTPIAADGVLYVTGQNSVYALDALTGNAIWHYSRPQSLGMVGDAALGTNRGVGLLGDRVFFLTDNAHLLALDRATGKIVWEVNAAPEMPASEHQHYGGTLAPLIVHDTVIVGVAGADEGIRGFVAAFHSSDGSLAWRRWTVPRKGEPGIETWRASEPITGGGSTWLTGSYDPATDMLYWPVGNPWPDSDDHDRPGDNLYTDSVLALNAETGDIKWYYQFTPHDRKDRDATEPDVLVDTTWRGQPRKLLLHANRNGFFYVIDRTDGKLLLAKPFLRRVDWASSIAPNGRPVVVNESGCPSDAANWESTAFSPLHAPLLRPCSRGVYWHSDGLPQPDWPALSPSHQHRYRRHRLGDPSSRPRASEDLVRSPGYRRRTGLLWSSQWRVRRRRSAHRETSLGIPDQCSDESLPHDLHCWREAIYSRSRRPQYSVLRSVIYAAPARGRNMALCRRGPGRRVDRETVQNLNLSTLRTLGPVLHPRSRRPVLCPEPERAARTG